jgi:hypothetical protein
MRTTDVPERNSRPGRRSRKATRLLPQPTAFFTRAPILVSSALVNSFTAK